MFSRIAIIMMCTCILSYTKTFASDETYCGVQSQQQQTQIGGAYNSASGTIKALFIFIDFPDDNFETSNSTWPVGTGPNYLNQIVDETETQNSGLVNNVTTFFKDMSFSQFKMIGKAYYRQAPHSLTWYTQNHAGQEAAYSAQDVIQNLDASISFSDFDQWNNGYYSHTPNSPDGVVDMVFICYRIWYLNQGLFGSSFIAEGWWGGSLPGDVYVDGGTRRITSTHSVNVLNMIQYPRLEHLLHEFGHTWGLNHQYTPGFWSLMGQRYPSTSMFMNALEREQLGWVNYNTITTTTTFTLPDFGSTGTTYRVQLPGTSEYYLLENHQKLTPYDTPDLTSGGQGLYILHNASGIASPNEGNLKVVTADGRWNWNNPYWKIFPGTSVSVPMFQRGTVNRTSGKSDRDMLYAVNPANGQGTYNYLIAWLDETTGQETFGSRYKGDGKDSWNLTNNTVFSPYSNPATTKANNTTTPVVIEVQGQSGSVLTVKVYVNDTLSSAPSKPQNPKVEVYTGYGDWNPKLTWAAMLEPDVTTGGTLEIQRSIKNMNLNPPAWSAWQTIATVSGASTQYIDQAITTAGMGNDSVKYRIRARDSQNKYSVYSEEVKMRFDRYLLKRSVAAPTKYFLAQNYPNPFNPTTTLRYELPNDEHVTLKVYDMLGKEVATIVNGFRQAGYYQEQFDASSLTSGVYIYRFTAGQFSSVGKMMLLR